MIDKRLPKSKMKAALLFGLGLLATMACTCVSPTGFLPTPVEVGSLETAVAQTVEASQAVEQQVQQAVAAALAAQEAANPVPDVAAPDAAIQPIAPVADPNLASGTPQLRVVFNAANVRISPGVTCRAFSALVLNSVVPVTAKNRNGSWFEIRLPNGELGWIADSVTDPVVVADMASVPVATNPPVCPPPPTATATATAVPGVTPSPTVTTAPGVTPSPTATATATAPAPPTPTPTATATTAPSLVTITVINNSSNEICFLFIDLSSDPWTVDRLDPTETIPVGGQRSFSFPPGEYDFRADDCNNATFASRFNEVVISGFTWDVR